MNQRLAAGFSENYNFPSKINPLIFKFSISYIFKCKFHSFLVIQQELHRHSFQLYYPQIFLIILNSSVQQCSSISRREDMTLPFPFPLFCPITPIVLILPSRYNIFPNSVYLFPINISISISQFFFSTMQIISFSHQIAKITILPFLANFPQLLLFMIKLIFFFYTENIFRYRNFFQIISTHDLSIFSNNFNLINFDSKSPKQKI